MTRPRYNSWRRQHTSVCTLDRGRQFLLLAMMGVSVASNAGCWAPLQSHGIPAACLPDSYRIPSRTAGQPLNFASLTVQPPADHILGPRDVLEVTIPGLFEGAEVRPIRAQIMASGEIHLPLIGAVKIGNMNLLTAQETINAAYGKGFLTNPHVSLALAEPSTTTVLVLGKVKQPGVHILPKYENDVGHAIAAAGGLTEDAADVIEVHKRVDAPGRLSSLPKSTPSQLPQILPVNYEYMHEPFEPWTYGIESPLFAPSVLTPPSPAYHSGGNVHSPAFREPVGRLPAWQPAQSVPAVPRFEFRQATRPAAQPQAVGSPRTAAAPRAPIQVQPASPPPPSRPVLFPTASAPQSRPAPLQKAKKPRVAKQPRVGKSPQERPTTPPGGQTSPTRVSQIPTHFNTGGPTLFMEGPAVPWMDDDEKEILTIPLRQVGPNQLSKEDVLLNPGDVVVVPSRRHEVFFVVGRLSLFNTVRFTIGDRERELGAGFVLPREREIDVVTAVAMAGYIDPIESPTTVTVHRVGPDGRPFLIRVDLIKARYDARETVLVQAGDIIYLNPDACWWWRRTFDRIVPDLLILPFEKALGLN